MVPSEDREIHLEDLGAWSSKGRRNAQEDAFGTWYIGDTDAMSFICRFTHSYLLPYEQSCTRFTIQKIALS